MNQYMLDYIGMCDAMAAFQIPNGSPRLGIKIQSWQLIHLCIMRIMLLCS